jgi:hypothetical protein
MFRNLDFFYQIKNFVPQVKSVLKRVKKSSNLRKIDIINLRSVKVDVNNKRRFSIAAISSIRHSITIIKT